MANQKPLITVELEPGQYLVAVHPKHKPRIWKHEGDGVFVGHGRKIRRTAIAYALNELTAWAEMDEGLPDWDGLRPPKSSDDSREEQ